MNSCAPTNELITNLSSLPRKCDVSEMFEQPHFGPWRRARINKLISILGREWFPGKKILELGCGFGHIGRELIKLGCDVTFAEGRNQFIDIIKKNNPASRVYLVDNDENWMISSRYDLIIHWGLLYHLKNWKQDLKNCLWHSSLICLETEVVDSDDPFLEIEVHEENYDGALNSIGVRPSVGNIENFLASLGCEYTRYDDTDLNAAYMVYDWKAGDFPGQWKLGHRRFWMIVRPR